MFMAEVVWLVARCRYIWISCHLFICEDDSISNVLHIHESAMKSMGGWDDTTLKLMYSVALNYFALIKERKGFSETWS